eukprot:661815-Pelagomonas_calceolata.AAC.1
MSPRPRCMGISLHLVALLLPLAWCSRCQKGFFASLGWVGQYAEVRGATMTTEILAAPACQGIPGPGMSASLPNKTTWQPCDVRGALRQCLVLQKNLQ